MPKITAWDVIKYTLAGMAEDINRKKMSRGVGKWNDMVIVKKKKEEKKAGTPPRMALSPKRAKDITDKLADLQKAQQY